MLLDSAASYKEDAAKFSSLLGKVPDPLLELHLHKLFFVAFLCFRGRRFLRHFLLISPRSCPEGTVSFITACLRSVFKLLISRSTNQTMALTFNFLVCFFSLSCLFCISFHPTCSFSLLTCLRVINNCHVTRSILGCPEISWAAIFLCQKYHNNRL